MRRKYDLSTSSYRGVAATWRRYWWLLASISLITAAVTYVTVRYEVRSSRTFTSSVDVRILPSRAELIYARETLGGTASSQTAALMRTFTEIIRSDNVISAALLATPEAVLATQDARARNCSNSDLINRLCTWISGRRPQSLEDNVVHDFQSFVLSGYRHSIVVSSIEGSFIMRISVSLPSPQASAKFAGALVEAYNSEVERYDRQALDDIQRNLERSLAKLDATFTELLAVEVALRESIGALSVEVELERLQSTLQEQYTVITTEQIRRQSLAREVEELSIDAMSGSQGASTGSSNRVDADPEATGAVQASRMQTLSAELRALDEQIAERSRIIESLEGNIGDAARKHIALRAVTSKQAELQRTSSSILSAIYSAEMNFQSSAAQAVVLRAASAPQADRPTEFQAALLFGAVAFVLSASLLSLPSALAFVSDLGRGDEDGDRDPLRDPSASIPTKGHISRMPRNALPQGNPSGRVR